MNITKAIEILNDPDRNMKGRLSPDFEDALKLGIEALKHCRDIHHMSYEDLHILLPGETPEEEVEHDQRRR